MFLIEYFRKLPVAIQITWVLAAAFILLLVVPTFGLAVFGDDGGRTGVETRQAARDTYQRDPNRRVSRRNQKKSEDEMSDEEYYRGTDESDQNDPDDGDREFERDTEEEPSEFDDDDVDDDE